MRTQSILVVACVTALFAYAVSARVRLAEAEGVQPVATQQPAVAEQPAVAVIASSAPRERLATPLACVDASAPAASASAGVAPAAVPAAPAAASAAAVAYTGTQDFPALGGASGLTATVERIAAALPAKALASPSITMDAGQEAEALSLKPLPVSVGLLTPAELVRASRFDALNPAMFSTLWTIKVRGKQAEARGEDSDGLWRLYWEVFDAAARQGLE